MSDLPSVHIVVGEVNGDAPDTPEAFGDALAEVEADDPPDSVPRVVETDPELIQRIARRTVFEILNIVAIHEPTSIRQTATILDRGHKEVLRQLTLLETCGLISVEMVGRSKHPHIRYSNLEIRYTVPDPAPPNEPAESPTETSESA